ncbi:MAG TPA: thiamine pyrophosphate-binding protein [Patescibacteria group bacterium]|nr:thiamine pyrophosphate-binding protein [Patescibacteria group bacterium]
MNPSVRDHGGDRVAQALQAHGIDHLFTLCGGHVAPILAAAKARGIRIVDTRHEASAVFAADAWARLSGKPGVAVVTAGPGVSNAVTALKNAQLAQSPLLLIGGAAPTLLQGRGALQDIAQAPLVQPHVKACLRVRRVADLGPGIARALQLAVEGVPGPVFVECPVDLLYPEAQIRSWYAEAGGKGNTIAARLRRRYLAWHANRLFSGETRIDPPAAPARAHEVVPIDSILRASALIASSERPLLVIGSQAVSQPDRATELADAVTRIGVPVYLSGMARGLLGRAHPLQRLHRRREALRESDCVILAGVPCDFRLDYGQHIRREAKMIALNLSARDARLNRRPDVALIAPPLAALVALAAATPAPKPQREAWLAQLEARDAARESEIDTQAAMPVQGEGLNPLALCRAIDAAADADAIFVADGGDFVGTAAYVLRPRGPLRWLDPGVFGTLGVGGGFALGAAMARPRSERWLLWGDGAAGFSLMEFDSFARQGVGVIAVIGNDAGWTQIAREQVKLLGDDVGTVLARSDYHRVAEGLGGIGLRVRDAGELPAALAQAKAAARMGKPVLVNVWLGASAFREGSLSM